MSRIGNKKIIIPENIEIKIIDSNVIIKDSTEESIIKIPANLNVDLTENILRVTRKNELKESKSLHGTYLRLIENTIIGMTDGFVKKLEYKGVGYTVAVNDNKLAMRLGFSHPIEVEIPKDLNVSVQKSTILIEGKDKEKVGLFAAKIREIKKPEVYKGKGIRYHDEQVKKKAGKAAQSSSS
jgi:large subunit ribosomal protein L6